MFVSILSSMMVTFCFSTLGKKIEVTDPSWAVIADGAIKPSRDHPCWRLLFPSYYRVHYHIWLFLLLNAERVLSFWSYQYRPQLAVNLTFEETVLCVGAITIIPLKLNLCFINTTRLLPRQRYISLSYRRSRFAESQVIILLHRWELIVVGFMHPPEFTCKEYIVCLHRLLVIVIPRMSFFLLLNHPRIGERSAYSDETSFSLSCEETSSIATQTDQSLIVIFSIL